MKTLIKVCGMTRADQVQALDDMGVDLLGFIFGGQKPAPGAPRIRGRAAPWPGQTGGRFRGAEPRRSA